MIRNAATMIAPIEQKEISISRIAIVVILLESVVSMRLAFANY